jgi:hypothetical protein
MKSVVFCDIKTQFVPHRRHCVSATELSRLMLFKTWGFHGGDYEECSLHWQENWVRTSQETNYVSAIESSRLMLCKILGGHGGDYEECLHLRCYAMWLLLEPTFRSNWKPPSSWNLTCWSYFTDSCRLVKEALISSETSVLSELHGVSSQKTPFFMFLVYFHGL